MPTAKPRITITLEPRNHEILSRLSAAGGESMSALVTQYLDLALPSLERLVVVLEQANAAPAEARAGLAAAIERADRQLLPALQDVIDQRDLFLGDIEAASRPAAVPGGRAKHGRQEPASAGRRGPKGGPTPVPVTRGSGGSRVHQKGARRGKV